MKCQKIKVDDILNQIGIDKYSVQLKKTKKISSQIFYNTDVIQNLFWKYSIHPYRKTLHPREYTSCVMLYFLKSYSDPDTLLWVLWNIF